MWSDPTVYLIAVPVALAMELWSMFLHGALWHGPLWFGHRSHHRERPGGARSRGWEANDVFALMHAGFAIALFALASRHPETVWAAPLTGVALGMTAFGAAYFAVHDGFIHGRLPLAWLARFAPMRRVRNAHLVHHHSNAVPYGLFLGRWELLRQRRRRARPAGGTTSGATEHF